MTKQLKIDYASDIHMGFWVDPNPSILKWEKRTKEFAKQLLDTITDKGDVLVLAGDFGESNMQNIWFLEECGRHYKHVIATVGNHDYYLLTATQKKKYLNSLNRVQEMIDHFDGHKTITFVRNKTINIDGFVFGVTPLWYTLTSEASRYLYRTTSNDSQYILSGNYDNWRPMHDEDMEYYRSLAHVDCMVTHVPPTHPTKNNYPYSEFYTTSVEELKAPHWICGHQHVCTEFEKAGTIFHMNPIGYDGELYDRNHNKPKLKSFILIK